MKIAMILDTYFPPDVRIENEAKCLNSIGFEVHLFSLCYKKYESPVQDFRYLKVHRYRGSNLLFKLSAIAHDFPLYNWIVKGKISKFLKKVEPDFIHVHDMVIAKAALSASKNSSCIKVLDLHENRPAIMEYYPHTQRGLGKLLINLKRWNRVQLDLINSYDHIVVVTPEARAYYLPFVNKQESDISVVPNTVHPEEFQISDRFPAIGIDANDFNLLYIGNTGLRRGTLFLIELLARLSNVVSGVRLVIVGNSSEDHILHSTAERLGISSRILFTGWQDPRSLPDYIDKASICFSPITRNLHHDTTFANKIFQYMAGGKPLIVSDCPPQKRIVEEYKCGFSFKAGNLDDCLSSVIKLYNNEDMRKKMGSNGKEVIRKDLNFINTASGLADFYLTSFSKRHI